MSDKSGIEWTDASWTPILAMVATPAGPRMGWHCEHVSEGCRNCYSEAMNRRLGTGEDFKPGNLKHQNSNGDWRGDVSIFLDEKMLTQPLRWRKPRKIFVCSMTDLFADFVPDAWIDRVFAVMALAPWHTFQVLTKRSARMREWFERIAKQDSHGSLDQAVMSMGKENHAKWEGSLEHWPLPKVWLGVSAEDQSRADERIPDLLATPAAVRFVSAEPLLSGIDFRRWMPAEVREHVAGAINLPSSDRLPSALLGSGGVPSNKPTEALQPFDDRAVGAVNRQARTVGASGASAPVEISFPVEQASEVSALGIGRRERDRLRQAARADETALDASPLDPALNRGARNTREVADFGDGLSASVEGGQIERIHRLEPSIDWLIVGGESGPGARPMHPDWARSIRDQCAAAGVPFFFKQWGEWEPGHPVGEVLGSDGDLHQEPGDGIVWAGRGDRAAIPLRRVGKRRAGRLLDGRAHDEMPQPPGPSADEAKARE